MLYQFHRVRWEVFPLLYFDSLSSVGINSSLMIGRNQQWSDFSWAFLCGKFFITISFYSFVILLKLYLYSLIQVAQLVGVLSHTPKGCRFNP